MMRFFHRQQAPQSPPMPLCDSHTLDSHDKPAWISLSNSDKGDTEVPQLPEVPELAPIRFSRMNFEVYTGWKSDREGNDSVVGNDSIGDIGNDSVGNDSLDTETARLRYRNQSLQSLDSFESSDSPSDSLGSLPSLPSFEEGDLDEYGPVLSRSVSHGSGLGLGIRSRSPRNDSQYSQSPAYGFESSKDCNNDNQGPQHSSYTHNSPYNHGQHSNDAYNHYKPSQPFQQPRSHSSHGSFRQQRHHTGHLPSPSSLQPWQLSEDEYNAYKSHALKKIKFRQRLKGSLTGSLTGTTAGTLTGTSLKPSSVSTKTTTRHRPPRIRIPQSPPKLQLISPQTPTLASAPPSHPPPSHPPPKLPPPSVPPSVAAYSCMHDPTGPTGVHLDRPQEQDPDGQQVVITSTNDNVTSTSFDRDYDNSIDPDTNIDPDTSIATFETATSSPPPPPSPPSRPTSPLTTSMKAHPSSPSSASSQSSAVESKRLLSRPLKAFRAAWDGKPRPKTADLDSDGLDSPRQKRDNAPHIPTGGGVSPSPGGSGSDDSPNPGRSGSHGNDDNPSNGPPSPNPAPSQTLFPQTIALAQTLGNNRSEEPDATDPICDVVSDISDSCDPERDILEDTHSSDFSDHHRDSDTDSDSDNNNNFVEDAIIQDSDATIPDDMNSHPRRVSSLSSTTSMERQSSGNGGSNSRELHQLSSITKGLVRNSPFFDLDEVSMGWKEDDFDDREMIGR